MDTESFLSDTFDDIRTISAFLDKYEWLIEAHGARFFTRKLERLVPSDWWAALLPLSEAQLFLLPTLGKEVFVSSGITPPQSLIDFLDTCKAFRLPATPSPPSIIEPFCAVPHSLSSPPGAISNIIPPLSESPLRELFTKNMTAKKAHEVERLADLIYRVAIGHGCPNILDLGCGQGYLMQALSFYYKLNVLGVDSSELQTKGCAKRAGQVQVYARNFLHRHPSIEPSSLDLTPVFVTMVCPVDTNITMAELSRRASAQVSAMPPATDPSAAPVRPKKNDPVPFKNPVIHPLLSDDGVILVGLHTCGDLAPTTLRLFHESPTVKAMVNVGCCYNLLTISDQCEHASASPVETAVQDDPQAASSSDEPCSHDSEHTKPHHVGGYPLSSICKQVKPQLSRTARVLSCQCVAKRPSQATIETPPSERDAPSAEPTETGIESKWHVPTRYETNGVPYRIYLTHRAQVFRAVLQVIYEEHYQDQSHNYSGEYSSDYLETFPKYCNHILNKLERPASLSDEAMEQLWQSVGVPGYHKLCVFDNLRVCLSPVIESLIMKDRILFLHEQNTRTGIHSRHMLFPIFDAAISPRNMAIFSTKSI